jgi:prevent-host-death family protein
MNKRTSKTKTWPMSEAQAHLGGVLNQAISRGPQTITRRGQSTMMVLSVPDFVRRFGRLPEPHQ